MSASATEPEILGELPAHVFTQLGIATSARAVWLGTDAITHIQHQRDVSRPDADVVLATLRRGVFNPVYCGLDHADVRRFVIVEYVSERPLWAYVSLKIVRAGMSQSSKDEIWVNTGFPLGLESLTRLLKQRRLVLVKQEVTN